MATTPKVRIDSPHSGPIHIFEWRNMAVGDVGEYFVFPAHADRCWEVEGTFGAGGTVSILGTNNPTYPPPTPSANPIVHDPGTVTLTLTTGDTNRLKQQLENCYQGAPKVTAGDGTTLLTVRLCVRLL